jgi:hypothetical protein
MKKAQVQSEISRLKSRVISSLVSSASEPVASEPAAEPAKKPERIKRPKKAASEPAAEPAKKPERIKRPKKAASEPVEQIAAKTASAALKITKKDEPEPESLPAGEMKMRKAIWKIVNKDLKEKTAKSFKDKLNIEGDAMLKDAKFGEWLAHRNTSFKQRLSYGFELEPEQHKEIELYDAYKK